MPRQKDERERTNKSLADERDKTNNELSKRETALEESADAVLKVARERAAKVLGDARQKADDKTASTTLLREERRQEDAALSTERASADERLDAERDARRRALAALLAREREETDHFLRIERERADAAIGSRDEFLAVVTHDVRNLLGGLALGAATLMKIPSDEPAHAAITREAQRIQRYTARMNRLVGDLLDLVSIESGHLAVVPRRENVTALLRDAVDAFQPLASAKKISLRTEVIGEALLAQFDHERILQVLTNLVGNAMKFTSSGGRIDLVVETVADGVRFSVSDSGPGIAADQLAVIFERYWQRRKDEHTKAGLGLGLYIARCIVEAHGGRIWAESTPSEGATFYFTLPAA